jgi:hypothetical protein
MGACLGHAARRTTMSAPPAQADRPAKQAAGNANQLLIAGSARTIVVDLY